jgi:hypothetical protein
MADNAPYYMFGLGVTYRVDEAWQTGFYVINGYHYLSHINNQPSYGAQLQWNPASRMTVTQNLYYGPDQSATAIEFWRFFSDSIIEWRDGPLTLATSYDIGTENAAELPGYPRTFWTGGALYASWTISAPWRVSLRPEFYWDRNGRLTGSEQLLKAITTTLEYKWAHPWHPALLRLEYRYDESTGIAGGFFRDQTPPVNAPMLVKDQQLLLFSIVWSADR